MQAQLACMLILCFTCGGLCSDVDQDQRVLEEELLSSIFNSKMKQNKQSAPYWRVSLVNLCRMVNSLRQEAWSDEQEDQGELTDRSIPLLEELYSLQHICRALQSREERLFQDSLEYLEDNSDTPLKRKSPYILKRQASHTTKSRRPYILKRTSVY
ncbi:neurotensin/neuromedin N [Sphaeramia orbicularis]|uniref:neurotensin/neuromedin N n=1 Tax=Sphaeramia orbicularis TaxID=375764 RepID=UPI00117D9556|nr:neurotensin/neuromedin N [Sphaeramia orbicularis]XP_029993249.1 neurotensin/neuromedin N [Sphaeramia orbicularis]